MSTERPRDASVNAQQRALRHHVPMLGLIGLGALLIALLPTYYVGLLATAAISSLVCIGLSFALGTGQVSLGHAAFVGVGAYASAILARDYGIPTVFAIPLAVLLCMVLAAILGRLTLGLRGHYLPLATLAWGVAIYVCFVAATPITGGASGFSDIVPLRVAGFTFEVRGITALAWGFVVLAYLGYRRIHAGRIGRVAKAIRAHTTMATAFGADVPAIKLRVFVASAALAALAGGLYACYMRFLSPTSFAIGASFNYLIMVVLGGVAHPIGAILGATLFVLIELGAQYVFATLLGMPGQMETMLFGVLLVVLLLRWPGGVLTWLKPGGAAPAPADESFESDKTSVAAHGDRPRIQTLEARGISKRFGGLKALSDVSVSVPAARITGLIGPNGAGKSTLFNVMTAVAPANDGSVLIDGAPLPRRARDVIRAGITRTFQHVQLVPELTILENVMIGGYVDGRAGLLSSAFGLDRAEEARIRQQAHAALSLVGLQEAALRAVGTLPLGNQRLVEVARALMSRPDVQLLDEPAAGLRSGEKAQLVRLLQKLRDERNMAILLVEHDMELVMSCVDHLFVLNYGELLAQGDRRQVQTDPAVIAAYLGA